MMKFKVVSEKTWQPIGFGMSIVRQLAHIVDGAVCYIGYFVPAVGRQAADAGRQDHDDGMCAAESAAAAAGGRHRSSPQPFRPAVTTFIEGADRGQRPSMRQEWVS